VVHKVLRTWFGSPTGMAWYEGSLIPWTGGRNPDEYYGRLLHTDAGPRQVRIYYVRIKGSGFDIDREDIVTSEDNWFRPSDICVAPDGSIFVSDWYDPGVGGHGMGDTTRGRIYRLTSKGQLTYRIQPPDYSHEHGILVALRSPNLATRFGGWQAAQRLDWNRLARLLCKEIEKESNLTVCARLAWLLTRTDDWYEYWPLLAQKSNDIRWQIMLVRIAKDRALKLHQAPQKIQHWLESQIRQETPLPVLREIALALRDEELGYAKPLIYKLARLYPGREHFYLVSLGIAVGHYDTARRQVLLEDFERFFPTWDERSLDLVWEWRPPRVIAQLDKYILNTRLPVEHRQRLVDVLANTEGVSGGEVMLRVLIAAEPAIRERAVHWCKLYLPTRWSSLRTSRQLESLINNWLEQQNLAASAMEIVTALESDVWIPKLSALAANEQNPVDLRRKALETLGVIRSPQASKALARFLSSQDLAKTAISSLGRQGTSNALKILIYALQSKDQGWEIKMDIVAALGSFRAGALWLLEHAQELEAPVQAEAIRWLRNSPFQDLRNKALVLFPVTKLSPHRLPEIAQLVPRRGDVQNGRRLFFENKDLGCARCHVVNGQGGKIGPELSAIGSKASKENLYESILYPDRAIADQFIQWIIETKQGVAVQGILVEETPDYLVLRDANGKDWKITKQDIMERAKSPRSLMPSDLLQYMSEQDLVDLVEFLQTLRSTPEKKP
ncbi:MAG: c-type cytochrome, partial [Gemmatales bacterium]|nr:c-type cytochrome [Gemmatales bacterium]